MTSRFSWEDVSLHPVPSRLTLYSLSLPECFQILPVLLNPGELLAVTRAGSRVTAVSSLQVHGLSGGECGWRAVIIRMGANAIGVTGVVSHLTRHLGVSGSEEMMYISTVSTDLVLVRESSFEHVMETLERTLASLMGTTWEKPDAPVLSHRVDLVLSLSEEPVAIGTIATGQWQLASHWIVSQCLALPGESAGGVFSIVLTDVEASWVASYPVALQSLSADPGLSSASKARPWPEAGMPSKWRLLQITKGFINSAGSIVAPVAAVLAQGGIPIYYLATADADYVLVQEPNVNAAVQSLQSFFPSMILTED